MKKVVHQAFKFDDGKYPFPLCGVESDSMTPNKRVTCKRCLKSLGAKQNRRDKESDNRWNAQRDADRAES